MIVSLTFNLTALNFVGMIVIVLLGYVLFIKYQARKRARDMALVRNQVLAFFAAAELQVEVTCFSAADTRKFTVCIDSQRLRKFKFSNFVEMVVIRYLARTTNVPVERIYWRFSMPTENENEMLSPIDSLAAEGMGVEDSGEVEPIAGDDYKVAEASWDQFEKVLQMKEAKSASV